MVWVYDHDYAAAEREFQTAIAMQPELASAHEMYGWFLTGIGDFDQGLREARRAVELAATRTGLAAMRERRRDGYLWDAYVATVHIGLGEIEEASAFRQMVAATAGA